MSSTIFENYSWDLIDDFMKTKGLAAHHIDSFDRFLNFSISKIIKNEADICIKKNDGSEVVIEFGEIYIEKPSMFDSNRNRKKIFPQDARIHDLTYASPIFIDIIQKNIKDGEVIELNSHKRIQIATLPVIVNSEYCNLYNFTKQERIEKGECENDIGGYFIIKGKERVLVGQLTSTYNTILVMKQKAKERYLYISEMRSMSEETAHSVLIQCRLSSDERTLVFSIPYIKEVVLVGVLFKALDCLDYEEMFRYIGLKGKKAERFYTYIKRDSYFVKTQEEALMYLGKYSIHPLKEDRRLNYAKQVVDNELFPHLGITGTVKEKLVILGKMVNKLINTHLGYRSVDDRDNYRYKRVQMAGELCADLFRTLFKRYIKTIQMQLEKKKFNPDITNIISRITSITTGMRQSFSTGNWGVQKNSYVRTGVSQVLNRLTFGASLSHLRRLSIPIGKEGKNVKIRQIHPSQIGFICPHESPEGQSVGIVLNLSLLSTVSRYIPTVLVREILESCEHLIPTADTTNVDELTVVILNGMVIGFTDNYEKFLNEMNQYKENGLLDKEISFTYDFVDNEIMVYCDEGRIIRPVYTVNNENKLNIDFNVKPVWYDLLEKNVIKYIDSCEAEESVIAMTPKDLDEFDCDYCEIAPATMMGVMASTVPFSNHTQAPRVCYQASHGKQALGVHSLAYNLRTDTSSYILDYPQKSLVNTKPCRMMGFDEMPSGVNAIVAIMTYSGFNMEDSIIMNQSSVDRGLFHVTQYRTVNFSEKKKGQFGVSENICVPPKELQKRSYNYCMLDEYGIVKKGSQIEIGDVLIGKVQTVQKKNKEEEQTDCSLIAKGNDDTGTVDRIVISENGGQKLIKIILRKIKIPEVGDKFSARSAQKGTVGFMYRQEDMPFTAEGIVPDLVINAHCIPSRMTIGQLMECVLGKECAIKGKFGDSTPFTRTGDDIANELCENLSKLGYERTGMEEMYSGFTGKPLKAKIFIGPTYYQRLKHMVSNKCHSRATGHVTTLMRQPLEGRSKEGGLRFGEMERDAMISHGCSRFLRERLFDQSDPYYVDICDKCGFMASSATECKKCNNEKISKVNLPYAAKLLFQELNAMGIKTIIKAKSK